MKLFRWILSLGKKAQTVKPNPNNSDHELPPVDYKPKYTLGVIVGHERKAPGAQMITTLEAEYFWNTKVAKQMHTYVTAKLNSSLELKIIYRDGVGISGAYQRAVKEQCDAVIELHFNSYNRNTAGTETLCTNRPEDIKFAKLMQEAMCEVFQRNGQSRGIKVLSIKDRGGFSVHQFPEGPNCLVEPFFSSNPEECHLAYELQGAYARCLVDAAERYFKNLSTIP